jgi:hypothetical protein
MHGIWVLSSNNEKKAGFSNRLLGNKPPKAAVCLTIKKALALVNEGLIDTL